MKVLVRPQCLGPSPIIRLEVPPCPVTCPTLIYSTSPVSFSRSSLFLPVSRFASVDPKPRFSVFSVPPDWTVRFGIFFLRCCLTLQVESKLSCLIDAGLSGSSEAAAPAASCSPPQEAAFAKKTHHITTFYQRVFKAAKQTWWTWHLVASSNRKLLPFLRWLMTIKFKILRLTEWKGGNLTSAGACKRLMVTRKFIIARAHVPEFIFKFLCLWSGEWSRSWPHETSACAAWAKEKAQIISQSSAGRPRLASKAGEAVPCCYKLLGRLKTLLKCWLRTATRVLMCSF